MDEAATCALNGDYVEAQAWGLGGVGTALYAIAEALDGVARSVEDRAEPPKT